MTDWIYCATRAQADAAKTQSLLRTHQVVRCAPRPPRAWPRTPVAGERLWLVWQGQQDENPVALVLGGGRLVAHAQERFGTNLLWTDPLYPGIRAEAVRLGYSGTSSMSFLRLAAPQFPAGDPPQLPAFDPLHPGLYQATPQQIGVLEHLLPIP
jgi:hypothetical protein